MCFSMFLSFYVVQIPSMWFKYWNYRIFAGMKFIAEINVMPHKNLLDPQGKAVTGSMAAIGLPQVQNVRVGKHITMEIEAANEAEAQTKTDEACRKLLANQVMEFFEFTIHTP